MMKLPRSANPSKKTARRRFDRRHITLFRHADELIEHARPCKVRITVAVEADGEFYTYNSTSDNWPPDVRSLVSASPIAGELDVHKD